MEAKCPHRFYVKPRTKMW